MYIWVLLILNIIFNAVIYYKHLPYKKNETIIVYCNSIYYINVKINEDSRIIVAVLSFKDPRNYKKELLFPCTAGNIVTMQLRVVVDFVEYFVIFIINHRCIILQCEITLKILRLTL